MEFPKAYIQERTDFRPNEAERKLYAFLKEYFTNAFTKVVSSVQYYLFGKSTIHSTDKFQVSPSIQISGHNATPTLNLLYTGGTSAAPTATGVSVMGNLAAVGYDGTSYAEGASVKFESSESWTGSAHGSYISFYVCPIGSTAPQPSGYINSAGSWASGAGGVATNATTGFLYVPTCSGIPTGTPEAIPGRAAVVIDDTNNKMYIYSGGAWVALN